MAVSSYGGKLRAAREAAGLSIEEATFRARTALKRPVSARTVGRLEDGTTPERKADERLVAALCGVYGVAPYAISVVIGDRLETLRALLPVGKLTRNDIGDTARYSNTLVPV